MSSSSAATAPTPSANDPSAVERLGALGVAKFFVIVSNVAKKANIGNMLRSSCAFGATEVVVAGSAKNVNFFGAQGTHKHVAVAYVDGLEAAIAHVKQRSAGVCDIVGIEIKDESRSVTAADTFAPGRNVAFMLGDEGHGLNEKQCRLCDYFVYIPHYGDGTASLNVAVAASIVFHRFSVGAGYPERERHGEKFVVRALPMKRGITTEEDQRKHDERQRKKQARAPAPVDSVEEAATDV